MNVLACLEWGSVGVGLWGPGGVVGAPWGGDGLGELFPGCGGEFAGVRPN